MVDPYYNGPSSLEIRKEYIGPVAAAFPNLQIIPYVIPGRTGTQLLPEDLALLHKEFRNVQTVKEATGNIQNMRRTRECCGTEFVILSGDDGMTCEMMTDPAVKASGVISVVSNVAPRAVAEMVNLFKEGNLTEGKKRAEKLQPLFDLVTVKTGEKNSLRRCGFQSQKSAGNQNPDESSGNACGSLSSAAGKNDPQCSEQSACRGSESTVRIA
jgi:4-hydroxy-tetrahydrodipicolinate synthase